MIRTAAVCLLLSSVSAFAYDLPRYDPNTGWCEYQGTLGGGHPEYRHLCIEKEQEAYEALKSEWPEATEEEQQHAIRVVAAQPYHGGSYEALENYLSAFHTQHENMRRVQEMKKRNEFNPD